MRESCPEKLTALGLYNEAPIVAGQVTNFYIPQELLAITSPSNAGGRASWEAGLYQTGKRSRAQGLGCVLPHRPLTIAASVETADKVVRAAVGKSLPALMANCALDDVALERALSSRNRALRGIFRSTESAEMSARRP
nr:hypothetical protein Iba_chr06cCG15490 [Ipomoea batatas]